MSQATCEHNFHSGIIVVKRNAMQVSIFYLLCLVHTYHTRSVCIQNKLAAYPQVANYHGREGLSLEYIVGVSLHQGRPLQHISITAEGVQLGIAVSVVVGDPHALGDRIYKCDSLSTNLSCVLPIEAWHTNALCNTTLLYTVQVSTHGGTSKELSTSVTTICDARRCLAQDKDSILLRSSALVICPTEAPTQVPNPCPTPSPTPVPTTTIPLCGNCSSCNEQCLYCNTQPSKEYCVSKCADICGRTVGGTVCTDQGMASCNAINILSSCSGMCNTCNMEETSISAVRSCYRRWAASCAGPKCSTITCKYAPNMLTSGCHDACKNKCYEKRNTNVCSRDRYTKPQTCYAQCVLFCVTPGLKIALVVCVVGIVGVFALVVALLKASMSGRERHSVYDV